MKQEYGVQWASKQELTDLLKEGEIKGPIDTVSLSEIHPRKPGKTLDYQELGRIIQQKYMQTAARMALSADCDIVWYNPQQRVSTKDNAIIIAMNFQFYQANKIEVYRNEEK